MPRAFLFTHRRYPPQIQDSDSVRDCGDRDGCDASLDSSGGELDIIGEENGGHIEGTGDEEDDEEDEDEEEDGYEAEEEGIDDVEDQFFNLTQLAEVAALDSIQLANSKTDGGISASGYRCSECGKGYTTSSNLARHRQVHRSPLDTKARRCPQCDKVYVSMPAYAMHLRTHSRASRCPLCGKAFSRPWLLQGHMRTHTGEKPFKCRLCGKAFADKSNLRAHVQTHSKMKPHVCTRCGKAFALKSYLYKHEESSCIKLKTSEAVPVQSPAARSSPFCCLPISNPPSNHTRCLNLIIC